jgi:exopolysaccharide biosynthesis predicted pyruvyltransferase EpsI/GT2 family glycosyltransferase
MGTQTGVDPPPPCGDSPAPKPRALSPMACEHISAVSGAAVDSTRRRPRGYSGRVIFDHLQKTAGMAINRWLRSTLGDGCASPNLITDHRSLIAHYGGRYSVLTAHVTFDGRGLDPRYQYVTLLREPIDRMVSWLHYVVGNYSVAEFGDGWHDVRRFLESEGAITDYAPGGNLYVRHFAAIDRPTDVTDDSLLTAALAAVEQYDVWGLFESMPAFLGDFAGLLGVPPPPTLDQVNVTKSRPSVAEIGAAFRARLEALNTLDLEFYRILEGRYPEMRRRMSRSSVSVPAWEPLPAPPPRAIAREWFTLHAASIRGGEQRAPGDLLELDVSFSIARPIDALVIEVAISDSVGNRVFFTDTENLERPIGPVAAGTHRASCTLVANVPAGNYSVGFRFREQWGRERRDIATFDELCVFCIGRAHGSPFVELPATIRCDALDASQLLAGWRLGATDPTLTSVIGRAEGGSVVSDGRAGHLLFGPYKTVIAGCWTAAVEGRLDPALGCIRIDVASDGGRVVHASLELTEPTERATLDFRLARPVHDIEIRVWVHEFAAATIDAIAVEAQAIGMSRRGGSGNGIGEGRIETIREASAAAGAAEAEAAPAARGPVDDGERADGTAARGADPLRDSSGGVEAGLVGPGDHAAVTVHRESGVDGGRTGGSRAHDARDADASGLSGRASARGVTDSREKTFSIVIATDGRPAAVAELLDTLPFLEGPPFEVCVVRGPTEDGIDRVLEAWRGRIKTACNPLRNLSTSRNLGIAMAAGEIVAFLDDDAIPEPGWLVDLAAAFDDPRVACAGGINRDRTGAGQQYGYATANRMGQARWDRTEPADALCTPRAGEFPYVQGTNAAIRRDDLVAIGGFDEEYDFYLDETDLCCRLIDAGRLVRQLPRAFVHHRSLPSLIRSPAGVTHSLHAVLKNKLYFSLVNNRGHHTIDDARADFEAFVAIQERRLRRMAAEAADGPRWLDRFALDVGLARATGFARGRSGLRRLMSPGLVASQQRPFLPLPRRPAADWQACPVHGRSPVSAVAVRQPAPVPASEPDSVQSQRELLRQTWAELFPAGSQVAVALYPDHRNVGDAAIWWGTMSLLRSLGVTVRYGCDPWSYDPDGLSTAHPHGPILLLGGGNFGDVYDAEQGLRSRILRDFPDRPIIQLPQSIWFRSATARDAQAAQLAACRDVTLLLRDTQSLAYARTHFPVRSLACPDAALALDLSAVPRTADRPVVALWRRDIEHDQPLPPLPTGSITVDWEDDSDDHPLHSWAEQASRAEVGQPSTTDVRCPARRRAAWRIAPALWDDLARERTLRGCRLLARGRAVITNRLHAHLLCTLLRIPHVVYDTVNGKISAYRDTWLADDPLVRFAASPDEAVAAVAEVAREPVFGARQAA